MNQSLVHTKNIVVFILLCIPAVQGFGQKLVLKPENTFANESIHILEWIFTQSAWGYSSYNGLSYFPEPLGTGSGVAVSPEILLDDVPVWTALSGDPLVTLYPMPLTYLDSVVVIREPSLYKGIFYPHGLVSIYTNKKLGSKLLFSTDNPVNDPGLFLEHDELNTVNVDRLKQNLHIRTVFGTKDRVYPISAGITTYSFTNPIYPGMVINKNLSARNSFYKSPFYFQTMIYMSSGFHWSTNQSSWSAFTNLRYLPRLYMWDESEGNEIPLIVTALSAGVHRNPVDSDALRVTLSAHLADAKTYDNFLGFDVAIQQFRGDFQATRRLNSRFSAGTRTFLYHFYQNRSAGVQSATFYDASIIATGTLGRQVQLHAVAGNLRRYLELRQSAPLRTVSGNASYFLSARLINHTDALNIHLSTIDHSHTSTGGLYQVGLEWSKNGISTSHTLEAIHWLSTDIPIVSYSGDRYPLQSDIDLITFRNAGAVQFRSLAGYTSEKVSVRSVLQFRIGVWGEEEFRNLNRHAARVQFLQNVQWRPDPNLTLHASLVYRSERYFNEFSFFDENSHVFPPAGLPSFVRISAGATQRMLRQRLELSLVLRNILHHYESNHPNGLYYPLILGIDVRLSF
jgi:hypothetical protein